MLHSPVPISDWDGQLPPHVARNEQIWWEVFPPVIPRLPGRLEQLLGGAKESPSREVIGKVVLVVGTRDDLRHKFGTVGGSLLNHWGTYCGSMIDKEKMVYTAGTATEPYLTFTVFPFALFAIVGLKFVGIVDPDVNLSTLELQKLDQDLKDALKESGREQCQVSVNKFKRGSWENGLDTAFKAAIWLNSNQEEALASIWKIKA